MSDAVTGSAEGPAYPASAKTLLRFQPGRPSDEPERTDAPVYLFAGHSDLIKSAIRAATSERGIRNPDDQELLRALAFAMELARKDMDPALFAQYASLLERYQALPPKADGETDSFDRLSLGGGIEMLYEVCEASNERLAKLLKMRRTHWADTLRATFAVVLMGVERAEFTVERVGMEATGATLAHIPTNVQEQGGLHWMLRGTLTTEQKKTSDSAPPLPTTPEIIPSPGVSLPPSAPSSAAASSRSRTTKAGTTSTRTTPVT
jgi:hypothetical protein